ncbi:MAG: FAD-dependent oxidoreductase [Tepidisphaeraceae bacterium]
MALPASDGQTLGNSILFTARRHETPQPFVRPNWVRAFKKEEFKFRPIHGFEYGYWWSEWGGNLSTIKDFDVIRRECMRIALGVWDYIKNSGEHPEAENYALEWVGAIPGKRESRRFIGPKVLVQDDVMLGTTFNDQVAYGGWWLDLHPPTGIDAVDEQPCVQHHTPHLYGIPLGILHSKNVKNLFMAGRNVSATHVAFASTRVMGTCAVMGQAIGTAASMLSASHASDIAASADESFIRSLQQTLVKDDAFLPGVRNDDAKDLARTASVTATSERPDAKAGNAINGYTRTVSASWGLWADERPNHWESAELPATIELNLPRPANVRTVHVTFDSGLQRELILTPSDHITKKTTRGAQPELVKDYDIYVDDTLAVAVRGNYLRHRVHSFAAIAGTRVSIRVLAAHGISTARVYEIRCYGA